MALLTDKETIKELRDRLCEFSQFGMVLDYMLEINKIDIDELENMFFEKDQEKATFIYTNLLKKITTDDMNISYDFYSQKYNNKEDFDESTYCEYLNFCCVNDILNKIIVPAKKIDKTYLNTYNYLLDSKNFNYKF